MTNLQKHPRSGVWRIRRVIPQDCRAGLGKREFLISLDTRDFQEARTKAAPLLAEIESQISHVRKGQPRLFQDQSLAVLALIWVREIVDAENARNPLAPDASVPQYLPVSQVGELDQRLTEFLARRDLIIPVDGRDFAVLRRHAWDQHNFYYPPTGRPVLALQGSSEASQKAVAVVKVNGGGMLMSALLEAYKGERKPIPDTLAQIMIGWKRFVAKFGDLPLSEVTEELAIDFKDHLVRIPSRGGKPTSASNVNKQLRLMQSVFEYGVKNKKLTTNVFRGVESVARNQDGVQRRPFEPTELSRLFGDDHRGLTGAARWVPLLGLWTGARLNELTQLHRDDVIEKEGVWCIRIDTKHPGQRIKNKDSRRIIPIHPRLIALGFLDYAKSIDQGPLFSDQTRNTMGKIWAQWSDKCGVSDPETNYHSFRHGFIDACRRARMEEAIQDRLTGHASPKMGRRYGTGYTMPILFEALSEISFPGFPG